MEGDIRLLRRKSERCAKLRTATNRLPDSLVLGSRRASRCRSLRREAAGALGRTALHYVQSNFEIARVSGVPSPKIFDTVPPPDHSRVSCNLPGLGIEYFKCVVPLVIVSPSPCGRVAHAARTRRHLLVFLVSPPIATTTDVPQPRVENRVARGTRRPAEREVVTGHFRDTGRRLIE